MKVIRIEVDGEIFVVEEDVLWDNQPIVLPSGKVFQWETITQQEDIYHVIEYRVIKSDHADWMPLDRVAEVLGGYLARDIIPSRDPFD